MEQHSLDLPGGSIAEGEPFATTQIARLPTGTWESTALTFAQAIVDYVETERAYLEQSSTHKRVKPHADGAVAKYPVARRRLRAIAAQLAKLNGAPRPPRGTR